MTMPAIVTLDLVTPPDLWVYPARLHGAVCALVEREHCGEHRAQRKPFSVGPLLGGGSGAARWRLGWLADQAPRLAPEVVRFGPHPCAVVRSDTREVPFASLAAGPPAWSAELDVISPLYFSRNGRDHPLPDPVLVLRSTMDRWNAFASAALAVPEPVGRELLATVWLAAMDGRTESTPVTATMHQTGFVGTARLALTRAAGRTAATAFAALMRFADIAGIGAQTTHGFGAVRLVDLNTAAPARAPYRSTPAGSKTPRSSQPRSRSSAAPPEVFEDHN
jgi:CRISPR-associated endoribonuclease Cas6